MTGLSNFSAPLNFPKEHIYIEKIEQLYFEYEPIRFYIKKLKN